MSVRILTGDCRDVLRTLPDEIVHCVVTSPPYWGLRDYGTATWEGGDAECEHIGITERLAPPGSEKQASNRGTISVYSGDCRKCGARRIDSQIGLEPSFAEYVETMRAVFVEVRRVLRKDGTLWLNLGDSYASNGDRTNNNGSGATGLKRDGRNEDSRLRSAAKTKTLGMKLPATEHGLKPKDLCGIPFRVAMALQAPQYLGRIQNQQDRVWIAAMLDAEGTICAFKHERKDGAGMRTGTLVFITNGSERILAECDRIWPGSRYLEHLKAGDEVLGATATRDCWRWQIQDVDERAAFLREIFPHLIEKRQQAVVGHALTELSALAKRHGRGGDSDETKEKRLVLAGVLSDLNQRRPTCIPSWVKEPPSMYGPGWYLRSDIIWSKLNPMPESVTDRPTKAHEYLFLLTKSERYHYDAAAIAEDALRAGDLPGGSAGFLGDGANDGRTKKGLRSAADIPVAATRNRRSVWEIATTPYSEAHFATFPPALVEPCIKAGCPHKACAKCGAPWVRETATEGVIEQTERRRNLAAGMRLKSTSSGGINNSTLGAGNGGDVPRPTKHTLGFSPACSCNADTIPGTVLDPFGGSGTVGLVALNLNRSAILIELNPDYVAMARNRVHTPLFAQAAMEEEIA